MLDLMQPVSAVCNEEHEAASARRAVALYTTLESVLVPANWAVLVPLVVRELLRNAFTHAYPPDQCAHVGLHLWRPPLGKVRAYLLVVDGGCGFDMKPPVDAASGLAYAQTLMRFTGNKLEREPGNGTLWRITLS
jgi:two-component sensor histidine kinase